MAIRRHARSYARRAALQVLYTSEMTGKSPQAIAEEDRYTEGDELLPEYARVLVCGVEAHRPDIDREIEQTSEHWSLSRMPIVDRSILRLATFEVLYADDPPTSVVINEAVALAKRFGGEDESHRFVNGVLANIALRHGKIPPRPESPLPAGAARPEAPEPAEVAGPEAPTDESRPEELAPPKVAAPEAPEPAEVARPEELRPDGAAPSAAPARFDEGPARFDETPAPVGPVGSKAPAPPEAATAEACARFDEGSAPIDESRPEGRSTASPVQEDVHGI